MVLRSAPHHIGYVVDDLAAEARRFATVFGAGPFLGIEHMVFDEITFEDSPAQYDHSSAFGAWGDMIVELTQVHTASPPAFAQSLVAPHGGVGHLAWLTPSLDDERDRLERLGFRPVQMGRTGPVTAIWFDAGPLLGHPIEVLQQQDDVLGFYAAIREASVGWDGEEPLRLSGGPGH